MSFQSVLPVGLFNFELQSVTRRQRPESRLWIVRIVSVGTESVGIAWCTRFQYSVCLSVSLPNAINPEPLEIITKFPGHHPMVERADKFENGKIGLGVHGW